MVKLIGHYHKSEKLINSLINEVGKQLKIVSYWTSFQILFKNLGEKILEVSFKFLTSKYFNIRT